MEQRRDFWQRTFYQVALAVGLIGLTLWFMTRLKVVVIPMVIGTFVAYALKPLVTWLRRHRVPGFLVLALPLGLVIALAVLMFGVVLPGLARELLQASRALPGQFQQALNEIDPIVFERFGVTPSAYLADPSVLEHLEATLVGLVGPATSAVTWLLSGAQQVIWGVVNIILTFVVAAFVIDDFDKIVAKVGGLVPYRHRSRLFGVAARIDSTLRGFIGGELVLFLLAALTFTTGLLLLNVPFAGLVGPIAAAIYLVPYAGFVTGLFLALSFSLLQSPALATSVGVLALFGSFYVIDLAFITPKVVGGSAGVAPLTVLLGILAGGELMGLLGILLAIPMLAVGQILLEELVVSYKKSAFFTATAEPDQALAVEEQE